MQCDICGDNAWHVCGSSGRPLCPKHSRIEVVARLSFGSSDALSVRHSLESDKAAISEVTAYFREGSLTHCFGETRDIINLPSFLAMSGDKIAGILSYTCDSDSLVIANMDVLPGYQGLGAGKMLIDRAKIKAAEEEKSAVLVSSTNDELPAIYFYQKNGFRIYEVKPVSHGSGEQVKVGFAGIPVRDEIRLRFEA